MPKNSSEDVSSEDAEFIAETDEVLNNVPDETDKLAIIKTRVGQGAFRKKLLKRSSKCEICGFDFKELLIASHCRPWSKSSNSERLDVNNGLLLCPNHDALFDKGLIKFNDDGSIILS